MKDLNLKPTGLVYVNTIKLKTFKSSKSKTLNNAV